MLFESHELQCAVFASVPEMAARLALPPIRPSIKTFSLPCSLLQLPIMTSDDITQNIVDIDWSDIGQAVPAFLTIAIMPLVRCLVRGCLGSWGVGQLPGLEGQPPGLERR
jgi:hypothetical protein